MQRVKLFKGVETDIDKLEEQVNAWIEESGARIISIHGNIAPQSESAGQHKTVGLSASAFASSDVLLVVLYEPAAA